MAMKSLLAVLTEDDLVAPTLGAARTLARGFDAHLDVLCLGVDRSQAGYDMIGAEVMVLQEALTQASEASQALLKRVNAELGKTDLRWSAEAGLSSLADLGRSVALRARYCDMMVAPLPYAQGRGPAVEAALEGALFDARIPVLVTPDGAEGAATPVTASPQKVVLAWNGGVEALVAARAAMPMLTAAKEVHVLVIDPPEHGTERSDPGGPLAQYLARHGVRVEIDVVSKTLPKVADTLRRHVADWDADLVVMGAYGHSRLREAVLGGVTRDMLQGSEVPVLMAH